MAGIASVEYRQVVINGRLGVITFFNDEVVDATTCDFEDGRVSAIYIMRNPDKLRHAAEAATAYAGARSVYHLPSQE